MRHLAASELLDIWERGLAQSSIGRAIKLLTACGEPGAQEIAELSIGERDSRLMVLRQLTFGPQIVCAVTCPACGEELELDFDLAEIAVRPEQPPEAEMTLSTGEYRLTFRLPNSLDLNAIADFTEIEPASSALLQRCLLLAEHSGQPVGVDNLPSEVLAQVSERIASLDPGADIQIAIACADCGHDWTKPFDIEDFFWTEIQDWAQRILSEVHALASRYGWSEGQILSLSPWRRQFYLQMAGA